MASRYERSLRNPLRRPLVGVPTHTAIKTKKISYRATAVVDCASYASETKILWMPHAGCAEDVDVFRVVGGSISSGANRTNSPFTASRFGDGLRARLVSARISVCGSSAVDNGVIVAGSSRVDDISDYNVADLVSRISEKHLVVARTVDDVVHMNYVPGSDDEREAFLDDVARGPYGGTRDITSEAYPARHVLAWQGESVDSEIITVPYTYNYPTKEVVYGDVDVPYSVTYNDPTLYYPWGLVQVPNDANARIDLSPDYGLLPVQLGGIDTDVFVSGTYSGVNGLNDANVIDNTFVLVNTDVPSGYVNNVNFSLGYASFYFVARTTSGTYNYFPKKLTLQVYNEFDGSWDEYFQTISSNLISSLYNSTGSGNIYHEIIFQLGATQKKNSSFRLYCNTWWHGSDFGFYDGSYYQLSLESSFCSVDPINSFSDGTCVHVVDNPVTVSGTVTTNQVTQVNEGIASETVSIPHEVVIGAQQLLVQVVTNWEFIGDPVDGSETETPSAVVMIGDGVLSDVFTTPRNTYERRRRMDDTAEGYVSGRERVAMKKLDMIEEEAFDDP